MKTTIKNCHNVAPQFWEENINHLKNKTQYGLLEYDKTCKIDEATYYIASTEKFKDSKFFNLKSW